MNQSISLIVLISLFLLGCSSATKTQFTDNSPQLIAQEERQDLPIEAKIKIGEQVIELEAARTPEQQSIGLMYRDSLAENRGMIFVFEELRPVRFWMKNVSIPLDMIFLANGKVKAVISAVPPCQADPCPTYGPDGLVNQVIELSSGRAVELGIKEGDNLDIEF
ncbi:MAG: DUF192 domain-containing protein, partial [Cyanobacteria bacterium P01_G01_bin.49]